MFLLLDDTWVFYTIQYTINLHFCNNNSEALSSPKKCKSMQPLLQERKSTGSKVQSPNLNLRLATYHLSNFESEKLKFSVTSMLLFSLRPVKMLSPFCLHWTPSLRLPPAAFSTGLNVSPKPMRKAFPSSRLSSAHREVVSQLLIPVLRGHLRAIRRPYLWISCC